ncbi:hypothetical protein K490DRAFT_60044 [Saccharata proteae CBS 121410]|uniref:Uncharacterized protein n=1 Tax=Saccharata proteae CBS 121410 TaxID=1314787 RepID=A0A9P4HQ82_9PEZI|nr:hypothetical protein K490DRAFT_60044 [Saccharata proteae CBS 121410]
MVTFYRCGDVTAAELEATARWIWSDADKVHDRSADMSRVFCARCAQSIACGRECDRSQFRCQTCSAGRRGGCPNLPTWMHGRIVRVTTLKAEYEVRKSMGSEDDIERVRIHDNYYILDADCAVTAESWHATVACCRLGTIWQRQGQGPDLFINLLAYSCGISAQLMCSSCGTIFGSVFVNLLAIFSSVFVVLLAVFGSVFVVLLAIFGSVFVVLLAVFGSVFVVLLAIFGSVFVDLLAIFGSVLIDLLAIFHGARVALA